MSLGATTKQARGNDQQGLYAGSLKGRELPAASLRKEGVSRLQLGKLSELQSTETTLGMQATFATPKLKSPNPQQQPKL